MPDKEFIADWLRHAKSDLNTSKYMFEDVYPKETEIAAYHCQQCAEKALKAFLAANDIEPPRIHNLRVLCDLCKNIDVAFSIMKDDCECLNPFGAEVRYPNELVPDEPLVAAAIERAQKIYNFCAAKVNAP